LHRVQGRIRAAFGEADRRAGVRDLAGSSAVVIERRETGTGFAGLSGAGQRGQPPARVTANGRTFDANPACARQATSR
jgi:hypothetical protein